MLAPALAGGTGAALRIARLALRHLPPLRRTMARMLAVGQLEHLTAGPSREPAGAPSTASPG
jgi:hypothetical protein